MSTGRSRSERSAFSTSYWPMSTSSSDEPPGLPELAGSRSRMMPAPWSTRDDEDDDQIGDDGDDGDDGDAGGCGAALVVELSSAMC
eukprot:892032-Prymnesium_polylepis.1